MKESSTYQAILEEGRMTGREEGRSEGAVTEARKLLRKFGDKALGTPDEQTALVIERIEDLARLEQLCDRLPAVATWQELLGQPAPRARSRRRPTS